MLVCPEAACMSSFLRKTQRVGFWGKLSGAPHLTAPTIQYLEVVKILDGRFFLRGGGGTPMCGAVYEKIR